MKKLTTADYRKWLVTNKARSVLTMFDPPEVASIYKDAQQSKNWKRYAKYKVGSPVDEEGSDNGYGGGGRSLDYTYPLLTGCVVREFYLKSQTNEEEVCDAVRFLFIEKDGQIVFIEEVGD